MSDKVIISIILVVGVCLASFSKAAGPTDIIGKINDRTLHRFVDVEKNIVCYTIEGGYDIHSISCVPLK